MDASHGDKSANRSHVSLDSANAKRSLSLAREGRYSDAMRSLGSSGCVPLLQFQNYELAIPITVSHPGTLTFRLHLLLLQALFSQLQSLHGFPKASSPGGSKLRCQHLLDVIEGSTSPSAQECLVNLTKLVRFLLSGQAHLSIAPWLCGAPLTALYKKQGGIRPIAVGEVLRRL